MMHRKSLINTAYRTPAKAQAISLPSKTTATLLLMLSTLLFVPLSYGWDGCRNAINYSTVISNNDRHNSAGQQLTSVRDILRQNRANYYGINNRSSSAFLGDVGNRAIFNTAPLRVSPPNLSYRIINGGNVRVRVTICNFDTIYVQQ